MDVKSDFLYRKIKEEVYVCQPPGFEDTYFLDRVYKVKKALYGLHQAPRAWYETLSTYLLDNEFQRGKIDKTLFIKRYKAYTDSDYARASLDRKSTTGGCQFLGCRLISWQCKETDSLHALMDGKKIIITESTMGRDLQLEDAEGVDYEAVYKELDDNLVRDTTTASSLEAEQDSMRCIANKWGGKKRKNAIDADEDITLVNDQDDADMFDVNTLTGDEVLAKPKVATKDVNLNVDEVTLAQALVALKSVKPKVKVNVIEESSVPVSTAITKVSAATTTTTATIPTPRKGIVITELGTSTTTITISSQPSHAKVQDKGKGIMIEPFT
ncbi:putative ribonuclease H-like domain-containing protein [Tanacetum coccineum]